MELDAPFAQVTVLLLIEIVARVPAVTNVLYELPPYFNAIILWSSVTMKKINDPFGTSAKDFDVPAATLLYVNNPVIESISVLPCFALNAALVDVLVRLLMTFGISPVTATCVQCPEFHASPPEPIAVVQRYRLPPRSQ